MPDICKDEDIVRPSRRLEEVCRNVYPPSEDGHKVTEVSVIPCRLNGDLHEGRNEVLAVPNQSPLNTLSGANARDFQWEVKTP
jgi:hypothetical protein